MMSKEHWRNGTEMG